MSCNEWEHGTIILPTKDVAPLKKALRDKHNAFCEKALADAKAKHKSITTKSIDNYHQALGHWRTANGGYLEPVSGAADLVLSCMLREQERAGKAPVTPTREHARQVGMAPLTNRDTTFRAMSNTGYSEASITFDGRTVTWDVPEGNHACDTARETVLAEVFFDYLDRIHFTRNTGGEIAGNNEYASESFGVGGGANYLVIAYGPLGGCGTGSKAEQRRAENAKRRFIAPSIARW